jgi:acyl-CoA synthetase (AMP-forming)/AMP-acid ligase II
MQIPSSLLHTMQEILSEDPDRNAVVFKGVRTSYGEISARSLALAEHLRGLGVKPGDNVAALVTPRPEALVTLFGVWLTGATWVGVNTRYKLEEQRKILADCSADILISITQSGGRDLTPDLSEHKAAGLRVLHIDTELWHGDLPWPTYQTDVASAWQAAVERFDPQIPAVIIYTSGSTGQPKGALITHAGLTFRSFTMAEDRFKNVEVRLILDLPVNHIGALASSVGLSLVTGGLMVMSEKFDPGFTLRAIEEEKLNVIVGVPAMMTRLVEHPWFDSTDFSSLRFVSWGAGPVSKRVLERLLQGTNAKLSQQYGMTESNGPIVYTPPTRDIEVLMDTTGKPDRRLHIRVADDDSTLPIDVEGEVQVKMPFPYAGYLNNPEATAESFTSDGFLKTGDRARIRSDGYLVFSGRGKEMYKSGGFNIFPREVEIVLESHPSVRAAAVLGKDDPSWGQIGIAFVELNKALNEVDISDWCKARLADFKVPKEVRIVDALPRTPIDKVDRVALANQLTGKA